MGRPRNGRRDLSLTYLVQTKLTEEIGKKADARARAKGLSMSSYLRTLIITDLEKGD